MHSHVSLKDNIYPRCLITGIRTQEGWMTCTRSPRNCGNHGLTLNSQATSKTSYYMRLTKSRPNPKWVKKNCLQTGGLKRVGPRSSFPVDPSLLLRRKGSPLSAALRLGTKVGTSLRPSPRPSEPLLDSPLRGERLRLRPIWNPSPVQVDPETAVQQLPGGREPSFHRRLGNDKTTRQGSGL